jgi:hypothetical protein
VTPAVQSACICFKSSRLWASRSRTRFCSARASAKAIGEAAIQQGFRVRFLKAAISPANPVPSIKNAVRKPPAPKMTRRRARSGRDRSQNWSYISSTQVERPSWPEQTTPHSEARATRRFRFLVCGTWASEGKNRAFNRGRAAPKISIGTASPIRTKCCPASRSIAGGFVIRKTTGIVTPPLGSSVNPGSVASGSAHFLPLGGKLLFGETLGPKFPRVKSRSQAETISGSESGTVMSEFRPSPCGVGLPTQRDGECIGRRNA